MSLFDGEGYPLPLKPERSILVIGEGATARRAAEAVSRAGGRPLILSRRAKDGSEMVGQVTNLVGWPGNFRSVIATPDGIREVPVGAVVVAREPSTGEVDWGGIDSLSLRAVTSGDLGDRVALMTGFWGEIQPLVFSQMLDLAEVILNQGGTPFLFGPQAKVAAPGLEERYAELRRAGCVVTRVPEVPRLTPSGERVEIAYSDPILAEEVLLTVDRVVHDPPLEAGLDDLAEALKITPGPDGWPTPDNVLLTAPLTSRAGVFAVGGRLWPDTEDLTAELDLLAQEIRPIVDPQDGQWTAVRLASERRECALCLTCLRTCPMEAIGWDKGPVVLENACLTCGQCAGVCPAAIIKPLWDEETALKSLLADPGEGTLVLACQRINEDVLEALPEEVGVCRLSCAGRISEEVLFRLLAGGYEKVLVAACHDGNCRSLTGSRRAERVVGKVRRELAAMGLEKNLTGFVSLAPHQSGRLLGALGLRPKREC